MWASLASSAAMAAVTGMSDSIRLVTVELAAMR